MPYNKRDTHKFCTKILHPSKLCNFMCKLERKAQPYFCYMESKYTPSPFMKGKMKRAFLKSFRRRTNLHTRGYTFFFSITIMHAAFFNFNTNASQAYTILSYFSFPKVCSHQTPQQNLLFFHHYCPLDHDQAHISQLVRDNF